MHDLESIISILFIPLRFLVMLGSPVIAYNSTTDCAKCSCYASWQFECFFFWVLLSETTNKAVITPADIWLILNNFSISISVHTVFSIMVQNYNIIFLRSLFFSNNFMIEYLAVNISIILVFYILGYGCFVSQYYCNNRMIVNKNDENLLSDNVTRIWWPQ